MGDKGQPSWMLIGRESCWSWSKVGWADSGIPVVISLKHCWESWEHIPFHLSRHLVLDFMLWFKTTFNPDWRIWKNPSKILNHSPPPHYLQLLCGAPSESLPKSLADNPGNIYSTCLGIFLSFLWLIYNFAIYKSYKWNTNVPIYFPILLSTGSDFEGGNVASVRTFKFSVYFKREGRVSPYGRCRNTIAY